MSTKKMSREALNCLKETASKSMYPFRQQIAQDAKYILEHIDEVDIKTERNHIMEIKHPGMKCYITTFSSPKIKKDVCICVLKKQ